jgi:hypothetical protein
VNATTRPLTRLVVRLGTCPDLGRPDRWHWYLVVFGAFLFAQGALRGAGWWISSHADPYAWLLTLCVGLNFASLGASGLLLRRGREALSMWLSIFQALLFFPMTAFLFLAVWAWLGLPWAVGLALAACAIFYAVRSRRSRQGNEGA